jgi:ElaB/YqjD/DUF883 family membrane-anchored ribosome-binding protein
MVNRIAEFFSESASALGMAGDRSPRGHQRSMSWDHLPQIVRPVEDTIIKNPGLAVAVAFAVGVTLACLIKRR